MEGDVMDGYEAGEVIDTSGWKARYVLVPVESLRVRSVNHEVVEWEATFTSEDCFPLEKLTDG
jgi:hypothetical protein